MSNIDKYGLRIQSGDSWNSWSRGGGWSKKGKGGKGDKIKKRKGGLDFDAAAGDLLLCDFFLFLVAVEAGEARFFF